jgi:hypothetical protein
MLRISTIFTFVLAMLLSTFALPAQAVEVPMARTTYAFFNVNSQEYTKGIKLDGVDMTWATGSGSTRKYIRAARVATLFKTEVKSSIYALTECDTQMGADLAHLMGSNWKFIGGDRTAHNKNGWLYDSSKWTPGNLSVTVLPGDQGRRLLQIGWYRRNVPGPNPMLSTATSHWASSDPESRDAQARATLDKIGGASRLLSVDTNASSYPNGRDDDGTTTAPRWVMEREGWEDFGTQVPSFHNYGKIDPGLPIDSIAVSKKAQDTDAIDVTWNGSVDTRGKYVSDHMVLTVGVEFRTP